MRTHFPFLLLLLTFFLSFTTASSASHIGVTYTYVDNFVKEFELHFAIKNFSSVHLVDPDPSTIYSFAGSHIPVLLSLPPSYISSNTSSTLTWLQTHVFPYHSTVDFIGIAVECEVEHFIEISKQMQRHLKTLGLNGIQLIPYFPLPSLLPTTFPPSSANFTSAAVELIETLDTPLFVRIPTITSGFPSQLNLFMRGSPWTDPNTHLSYSNSFDIQIDALLITLNRLGKSGVKLFVGVGWPTAVAEGAYHTVVHRALAEMFYRGLMKSPKLSSISRVFVHELFDSHQDDERAYWGILNRNLTPKFDWSSSPVHSNDRSGDLYHYGLFLTIIAIIVYALGVVVVFLSPEEPVVKPPTVETPNDPPSSVGTSSANTPNNSGRRGDEEHDNGSRPTNVHVLNFIYFSPLFAITMCLLSCVGMTMAVLESLEINSDFLILYGMVVFAHSAFFWFVVLVPPTVARIVYDLLLLGLGVTLAITRPFGPYLVQFLAGFVWDLLFFSHPLRPYLGRGRICLNVTAFGLLYSHVSADFRMTPVTLPPICLSMWMENMSQWAENSLNYKQLKNSLETKILPLRSPTLRSLGIMPAGVRRTRMVKNKMS